MWYKNVSTKYIPHQVLLVPKTTTELNYVLRNCRYISYSSLKMIKCMDQ